MRYYLALFEDLRRFGDVIEGRVPVQGAPAALVGDWGEGKGGGGSVHDEQRKGEGKGGGREGSYRREQYEGRALPSSTNTLPSSVSSDANNPKPSVLGRGPSQCRILRYSARVSLLGCSGRLWGVYKPEGGERSLTVSIPPPLFARRRPCMSWSCRWREGSCCCCPSCCPYDGGYAARTHDGGSGKLCCRVVDYHSSIVPHAPRARAP